MSYRKVLYLATPLWSSKCLVFEYLSLSLALGNLLLWFHWVHCLRLFCVIDSSIRFPCITLKLDSIPYSSSWLICWCVYILVIFFIWFIFFIFNTSVVLPPTKMFISLCNFLPLLLDFLIQGCISQAMLRLDHEVFGISDFLKFGVMWSGFPIFHVPVLWFLHLWRSIMEITSASM